jgi:hypothetical protein
VKIADNIVVPTEKLPAWMIELAEQVGMIEPGALLQTGVILRQAQDRQRGDRTMYGSRGS